MSGYDLLRYAKQGIIIPLENLIDNICRIYRQYLKNIQNIGQCVQHQMDIFIHSLIEQLGVGKEAIQAIGDVPYTTKNGRII